MANDTECYSLVGSNYGHFGNGDDKECVDGNLFILTPQPSDVITVQPGDVVGIYVDGERFQLDRSYMEERVWYRTFNLAIFRYIQLLTRECHSVGPNGWLNSLIAAAPVLSVSVCKYIFLSL